MKYPTALATARKVPPSSEEITDAKIDWSGETQSQMTVKVTNTGDNAAKHAVQLYVSLPYTDYDKEAGVEKPRFSWLVLEKQGKHRRNPSRM